MANTQLDIPDGIRTLLYDKLIQILKANPQLSSIVNKWYTWDGTPTDSIDLPRVSNKVNIRLTPRVNQIAWWTPDSQKGWLILQIEAMIPGSNIRDILNLQEMIENVFYPPTHAEQVALQVSITNLQQIGSGATTGQIIFSAPLYDDSLPTRSSQDFMVIGEIMLEFRRLLNR